MGLDYMAFMSTKKITGLTVPDSVRYIDRDALAGLTAVTSLTLPKELVVIRSGSIRDMGSLESLVIPPTVQLVHGPSFAALRAIGSRAFASNYTMYVLNIPEGVEVLEGSCFSDCDGLVYVKFPSTLKTIEDYGYNAYVAIMAADFPTCVVNQPAAVPAAPAASFDSYEDYMEMKFVATTYTSFGNTMDASTLGAEYAVTFHANNTCEFIMAGINTPGLTYGLQEVAMGLTKAEAFVINYYGVNYNCIPTATGFDMDFYGTMNLHFVPAQ